MNGKMVIISAPSGAGKSTIIKYLMEQDLHLEFSVSATTREPRGDEKHGKEYYFIPVTLFKKRIKNGDFIEWQEVYKNQYYGTLKEEIERIHKKGNNVLFDVDAQGGINLKKIFCNNAVSIFIMPPSQRELEKRLLIRGTDNPGKIRMRVEKAQAEMRMADQFDHIVINDSLELAEKEVCEIVKSFTEN